MELGVPNIRVIFKLDCLFCKLVLQNQFLTHCHVVLHYHDAVPETLAVEV